MENKVKMRKCRVEKRVRIGKWWKTRMKKAESERGSHWAARSLEGTKPGHQARTQPRLGVPSPGLALVLPPPALCLPW